jgi:hypothetical protein
VRKDETFEDLPPAFVERLKAADRPLPLVTARVDRALSEAARARFAGRGRRQPRWRGAAGIAAAASVLLAVLALQWPWPAAQRDTLHADVDGSGRIDIADVLALAREPGGRSQKELDAFAYRIVSLEHRPGDAT